MAVNLNALAPQKPEDVRVNTARNISAPLTPADVQGEVTQQDYNNLIRGRQLIQEKPPEEKSVDQQVAEALPGVEVKQTPEPEVEIIPEAEQAPNLPFIPGISAAQAAPVDPNKELTDLLADYGNPNDQTLPATFYGLEAQGKITPQNRNELRATVGATYRRLLFSSPGNNDLSPNQIRVLRDASKFYYVDANEKGEIIYGPDGSPQVFRGHERGQAFTSESTDINGRVIELAEGTVQQQQEDGTLLPVRGNPSLVYMLEDSEGNRALFNPRETFARMEQKSDAIGQDYTGVRFFLRSETEDGGLDFFNKLVRKYDLGPTKQVMLARRQGTLGLDDSLTYVRKGRGIYDTAGLLGKGLNFLDRVITDFTLDVPLRMTETAIEMGAYSDFAIKDADAMLSTIDATKRGLTQENIDEITDKLDGNGAFIKMPLVYGSVREYYESTTDLSPDAIDFMLGYTPDAFSVLTQFGLESLVFGGGVKGITTVMSGKVLDDFAAYVTQKYGPGKSPTEITDADVEEYYGLSRAQIVEDQGEKATAELFKARKKELADQATRQRWSLDPRTPFNKLEEDPFLQALQIAEQTGKSPFEIFKEFLDQSSKLGFKREMLASLIDGGIARQTSLSPEVRKILVGPEAKKLQKEIRDLELKIVANDKNPGKVGRGTEYRTLLEGTLKKKKEDLQELSIQARFPPSEKAFWLQEARSTFVGATVYQFSYQGSVPGAEGSEFYSGMLGALGSIATIIPQVNRFVGDKTSDVFRMVGRLSPVSARVDVPLPLMQRPLTLAIGEEVLSPEAVTARRALERAPPVIQDQYLAFLARKEEAADELSAIVYPETYPVEGLRGQPIVDRDDFVQAFVYTAGLLGLDGRMKEMASQTQHISRDVAKFSKKYGAMVENHVQKYSLTDKLGKILQALDPVKNTRGYDANSNLGIMLRDLQTFYDQSLKNLKFEEEVLLVAGATHLDNLKTAINGQAAARTPEEFAENNNTIKSLLALSVKEGMATEALEQQRTLRANGVKEENIPALPDNDNLPEVMYLPNATESSIDRVNETVDEVFTELAKLSDRNTKAKIPSSDVNNPNSLSSNDLLVSALLIQEQRAYHNASAPFNALRAEDSPYKDARIDTTDIFFELAGLNPRTLDNLDEAVWDLDEGAIEYILPILKEGETASRKIQGVQFKGPMQRQLLSLFESGAEESVEQFLIRFRERSPDTADEMVEKIYQAAELTEDSSFVDKFIAIKKFMVDELGGKLTQDAINELTPRIGLDVPTYMQIVSGISADLRKYRGKPEAVPLGEAKRALVDQAEENIFVNFHRYGERQTLPQFAKDWSAAKTNYLETYINPFREMSPAVARMLKSSSIKQDMNINFISDLLKESGYNKEILEPADALKLNRKLAMLFGVKQIDLNTPQGQVISNILTRYVYSTMEQLPGTKMMKNIVDYANDRTAILDKTIPNFNSVDVKFENLEDANGIKFKHFSPDIFVDVNGKPIIDPNRLDEVNAFEKIIPYVREANQAVTQMNTNISRGAETYTQALRSIRSPERMQLEAGLELARALDASENVGAKIVTIATSPNGLAKLDDMGLNFVRKYKQANPDAVNISDEEILTNWRVEIASAVQNHIFEDITTPANLSVSKEASNVTYAQRQVGINQDRLLDYIGYKGESVQPTERQRVIRELLQVDDTGPNVYDTFVRIGETLFGPNSSENANLVGLSRPLSGESLLSRGTSYFRGVISLRWLLSEAAIRAARQSEFELTKLILFDPRVAKEIEDTILKGDFNFDQPLAWVQLTTLAIARTQARADFLSDERDTSVVGAEFERAPLPRAPRDLDPSN